MHLKCLYCLDIFDSTQESSTTPCGHVFHINCITPWMNQHNTCPECRNDCSIEDLIRIYFSGASDESVHLNDNCPIKELLDIEKQQTIQLKDDNEKITNDFDEMLEAKGKLEIDLQIANDKITTLTGDLLISTEENTKLKSDLEKLEEKCTNFPTIIEGFMDKTLELNGMIESLKEDAESAKLETNFQQEQLNLALLQNFKESENNQQLQFLNSFNDNNNNNDRDEIEMYQSIVAAFETDIDKKLTEISDLEVQLQTEIIKNEQLKDNLHTSKTEIIELKLLNLSLRLENPINNNNSDLELTRIREKYDEKLLQNDEEIKELKRINLALANKSIANQIIASPNGNDTKTNNTSLKSQQSTSQCSLDVINAVTETEEMDENASIISSN